MEKGALQGRCALNLRKIHIFLANGKEISYNNMLSKLWEVHWWQNFISNTVPWAPVKRRRH